MDMLKVKPVDILMELLIDPKRYRILVRKFEYLTLIIPNILFA